MTDEFGSSRGGSLVENFRNILCKSTSFKQNFQQKVRLNQGSNPRPKKKFLWPNLEFKSSDFPIFWSFFLSFSHNTSLNFKIFCKMQRSEYTFLGD